MNSQFCSHLSGLNCFGMVDISTLSPTHALHTLECIEVTLNTLKQLNDDALILCRAEIANANLHIISEQDPDVDDESISIASSIFDDESISIASSIFDDDTSVASPTFEDAFNNVHTMILNSPDEDDEDDAMEVELTEFNQYDILDSYTIPEDQRYAKIYPMDVETESENMFVLPEALDDIEEDTDVPHPNVTIRKSNKIAPHPNVTIRGDHDVDSTLSLYSLEDSDNDEDLYYSLHHRSIIVCNDYTQAQLSEQCETACSLCFKHPTRGDAQTSDCGHTFCKTCYNNWECENERSYDQYNCPDCYHYLPQFTEYKPVSSELSVFDSMV